MFTAEIIEAVANAAEIVGANVLQTSAKSLRVYYREGGSTKIEVLGSRAVMTNDAGSLAKACEFSGALETIVNLALAEEEERIRKVGLEALAAVKL